MIAVLAAAPALLACGGAGSAGSSPDPEVANGRLLEAPGPGRTLKVRVPNGAPPKDLIVKDLREGSGPAVAHAGDEVLVAYAGFHYGRKPFYDTWEQGGPTRFHLHDLHSGWERGVNGMRVGGWRELIVPSRLAYHTGTIVYVVDLLRARRWQP